MPPGLAISNPDYREVHVSGVPQYGGLFEATILLSNSFGTHSIAINFDIDDDFMPKFQPLGQVQVEVGEPVHIQPDLLNPPEVLEVENLPDGLLFNPFTGEITGAVGAPGFYEFTMVATNAHGEARLDIGLQVGESNLTITRLPEAAPKGSWVDVEGAGFSMATQVLAIDPWRNSIRATEFEVLSDTLLRFRVPDNFHRIHERGVHLVVVTPQAAVATVSPGFHEVVGLEPGTHGKDNLVRDGGRIEGGGGGLIAYLESGAVNSGASPPPPEMMGMALAGNSHGISTVQGPAPQSSFHLSQTGDAAPEFSYRRIRTDGVGHVSEYRVGDLTYVAEISEDLFNWNSGPEFLIQVGQATDNGDGSETAVVRPLSNNNGSLFFRVRLVRD